MQYRACRTHRRGAWSHWGAGQPRSGVCAAPAPGCCRCAAAAPPQLWACLADSPVTAAAGTAVLTSSWVPLLRATQLSRAAVPVCFCRESCLACCSKSLLRLLLLLLRHLGGGRLHTTRQRTDRGGSRQQAKVKTAIRGSRSECTACRCRSWHEAPRVGCDAGVQTQTTRGAGRGKGAMAMAWSAVWPSLPLSCLHELTSSEAEVQQRRLTPECCSVCAWLRPLRGRENARSCRGAVLRPQPGNQAWLKPNASLQGPPGQH